MCKRAHARRFSLEDSVSGTSNVKSSTQRTITKKIREQYPRLEAETLELLMPKKKQVLVAKW